jgi:hypothetical protein
MRIWLLVILILGVASSALADDKIRFGFDTGIARQHSVNEAQQSRVTMFFVHGQIIGILKNPSEQGFSVALMVEPTIAQTMYPDKAIVFGINTMPRIMWGGSGRLRYFINSGAGINSFGLSIPELTGKMQFTLQFGGGIMFRKLGEHKALTLEYRVTHFSNANTSKPNHGINLHTLLLGVNFW